jgi:hypothetical protein
MDLTDVPGWAQTGVAIYLAFQLNGAVSQLKDAVTTLKSLVTSHDTRITNLEIKHAVPVKRTRPRRRRR